MKVRKWLRATQTGQHDLVPHPNLAVKLFHVLGLHNHDEIVKPETEFIHSLRLMSIEIKIDLPAILHSSRVSREPYATIKTAGIRV